MTGPVIPADQWRKDEHALVWDRWGVCRSLSLLHGTWFLSFPKDIPMPAGHDWRVPVMRPSAEPAPAIDLEQFREAVESLRLGATRAEHHEECDRLLALIDGQAAPAKGQPSRQFVLDVLGNPMRKNAAGEWESAVWPSDQPTKGEGE